MSAAVRIECDIPGLRAALHARGIRIANDSAAVLAARMPMLRHGPLILLVDTPAEVVAALDAGADDAVPRGAAAEEIAARVAARLRPPLPPLTLGTLVIDRIVRRATREGRALGLLPREYALLLHLARHAPDVVSRSALLEAVWSLRFDPGTNVVAVHVSRLRAKLDRGFPSPMLRTEPGAGYRLVPA